MTDAFTAWQQRYPEAAAALRALAFPPAVASERHGPEAVVQANVRLEASRKGHLLFRNNVGAGYLDNGSFVRWGLANESERVNEAIKSADLIGIERVLITPEMVGSVIGRFLSRECKHSAWRYTGDDRERAQLHWANIVNSRGGNAAFAIGEGTL